MKENYKDQAPALVYEFLSYMLIERGYSKESVYSYFTDLRLFFRFALSKKQGLALDEMETVDISKLDLEFIEHISRRDVSGFLTWLVMEKQVKEPTRNRKISVLKSFFHFLVEQEYLEKNIMLQIKTTKIRKTLPKYLEEREIELLLSEINGTFWIRDTAIIMLMMSSGLRVSEVVGLDLKSLKRTSISVLGKGNKERQVYLSPKTMESLKDYLEIRPFVESEALFLSSRKGRLSIEAVQKMTKIYLTRIGKGDYSCHKLRHTAATQLLQSGANLREIQEILGHESISTTEIYTHVSNDDLQRVAENLRY